MPVSGGKGKKGKSKNSRWIPDAIEGFTDDAGEVLGNLGSDVKDLAGIPKGMLEVGKALGHDAKKAAGFGKGSYKTDDILKLIADDYRHTYAPLFAGDFATFGKRVAEHPLGPILDVLTIATLGVGAAAKGARTAGIMGAAPKTYAIKGTGNTAGTVALHSNPLIAMRQKGYARLGERIPDAPIVGANRRIAHQASRQARLLESADQAAIGGIADKLARRFSEHEKAAYVVRAGGFDSPDELVEFWAKRRGSLEKSPDELKLLKQAAGEGDDLAKKELFAHENRAVIAAALDKRLKLMQSKRTRELVERPTKRLEDALAAGRESAALTTAKLVEGGVEPRAERPFLEQRVVRAADRPQRQAPTQAVVNPRRAELESELASLQSWWEKNGNPYQRTPLHSSSGENGRGRGYRDVREKYAALKAELDSLSADDAAPLAQVADDLPQFERTGDPFTRTHVTSGRKARSIHRNSSPAEAKFDKGWNFEFALDSINPGMAIRSYQNAVKWHSAMRRHSMMLEHAVPMEDVTGKAAKGMVELDNAQVSKYLNMVDQALEQADVVFGDSPQVDAYRQAIRDEFMRKFPTKPDGTAARMMVPKAVHDRLLPELRRTNNFLARINRDFNGLWRAVVLNLRPAWIVNNVVGQMFLLLASQNVLQTGRAIMATRRGSEARGVVDNFAAPVLDMGFGRSERFFKRDMADLTKRQMIAEVLRRPADGMARLNAVLAEDGPRRWRFYSLLQPHVKRMRKSNPSLTFTQAAEQVLADPDVLFHIQSKVLDDLIDFRNLSPAEQGLRQFVPFYSWLKGSTQRTARMVADDPATALGFYSLGKIGVQMNEDEYGALPSYLRGAIPAPEFVAKWLGEKDGEPVLIPTAGMNPFQTPVDVADMFAGLFSSRPAGGGNPLAQLGPLPKSFLEATTNRQMFGGYPVMRGEEGRYLQKFGKQVLLSTPQTQAIAKQFREPPRAPLYAPDPLSELLKMLGLGARRTDLSVAHQRALEEKLAGAARPY